MKKILFIFLMCLNNYGFALFDDYFTSSKNMSMPAMTAYESPYSYKANPAAGGYIREVTADLSHNGSHFYGGGDFNYRSVNFDLLLPFMYNAGNFTYLTNYNMIYADKMDLRTFSFGFASWHYKDWDTESLDGGFNIKMLNLKNSLGDESKISLDVGLLLRLSDYNLGFSILNLTSPKFSKVGNGINASKILKFGIAKNREDYSLSFDITKRDSIMDKSYNLSAGFEHYWHTYRYGSFITGFGLSGGDNKSFFSTSLGFKKLSYELLYSAAFSLKDSFYVANSISLSFKFGLGEEESEYQKIISQEMKYRKDLMQALNDSENRQKKLIMEINNMQKEIESLMITLKNERAKKAEVDQARKNLESVLERQRKSQEELKLMEEKRKLDRLKQIEDNFHLDWQNYLKIKSSGANKDALKGYLQRLINQYQSEGIDISPATVELQKLLR
jgi:ElaB/YqjD/DUF883 family membrane-anchored ribosome-binding protein